MPEAELQRISDSANMIVAGFSYTKMDNNRVRVLNLEAPEQACVLQTDGTMLETSMDDVTLALAQGYYLKNREFMEV